MAKLVFITQHVDPAHPALAATVPKIRALADLVDEVVVLTDSAANTMIVEIPSPDCVGAGSPFADSIAFARAKFDSLLTATDSFQGVSIPVRVTVDVDSEAALVMSKSFKAAIQPGSGVIISFKPVTLGQKLGIVLA